VNILLGQDDHRRNVSRAMSSWHGIIDRSSLDWKLLVLVISMRDESRTTLPSLCSSLANAVLFYCSASQDFSYRAWELGTPQCTVA
jgi:hypothetical protein